IKTVEDNDAIIFFNFRPDRAIQLSRAVSEENFSEFDLGDKPKGVILATMTNYTDEMNAKVLFPPQLMKNVLGEVLSDAGLSQVRVAETEKFPHVTFFMNGG